MAFEKGSLGDNQKVKDYTDGFEGRVDKAFKDVEEVTDGLRGLVTSYTDAGWKVTRVGDGIIQSTRWSVSLDGTKDPVLTFKVPLKDVDYGISVITSREAVIPSYWGNEKDRINISFRGVDGTRIKGDIQARITIHGER